MGRDHERQSADTAGEDALLSERLAHRGGCRPEDPKDLERAEQGLPELLTIRV